MLYAFYGADGRSAATHAALAAAHALTTAARPATLLRITERGQGLARIPETMPEALCVVEARYTEAQLQRVIDELGTLPGMLGGGSSRLDSVEAHVLFDDGSIQAWADQEYGQGLVTVTSALVLVG